jgi:hypothetical protein
MSEFIQNPRHIFECYYPPAPEEIEFFQHPVYPIGSYSHGLMEMLHDTWNLSVSSNRAHIHVSLGWSKTPVEDLKRAFPDANKGSDRNSLRLRGLLPVLYECYFQTDVPRRERIILKNFNPYDLRKENMTTLSQVIAEGKHEEYLEKKHDFTELSVEEMNNKARQAINRGLDPVEYLGLIVGNSVPQYQVWKKRYLKFGLGRV